MKQVSTKWVTLKTNNSARADIYIDDYFIGKTPYYGNLTVGKHKLRMECNGEKKKRNITISNKTEFPFSMSFNIKPYPEDKNEEKMFVEYEEGPEFPGGYEQMLNFFHDNLRYSVSDSLMGIQGIVHVQCTFSETGKISNVRIESGISSDCDKEAVRLVKMMPKWLPFRQFGYAVPVIYHIPVKFQNQIK